MNGTEDQGLSALSREILGYLVRNPDAQDTARGIAQWWLGRMEAPIEEVRIALGALVARKFVLSIAGANGSVCYGLNPKKRGQIESLLGHKPEQ